MTPEQELEVRMTIAAGRWADAQRLVRSFEEQPRKATGQWHDLQAGDRVLHETEGSGRIVRVENDDLMVEHDLFPGQLKKWSAAKVSKL